MPTNTLLFSIRPQYAEKIFNQTKTVELRRVSPKRLQQGDIVLVYVSAPAQSIAGAFKVADVIKDTPQNLWDKVKGAAGITRQEFDAYYTHAKTGTAIFFNEVKQLPSPIHPHATTELNGNFHAPQSFRYATPQEISLIFPQLKEFVNGTKIVVQKTF